MSTRASRSRRLGAFVGLLCISVAGVGWSAELARSRAAQLIEAHDDFRATLDTTVPVGVFWDDYRLVSNHFPDAKILADKGILTIRESGKGYAGWYKEYIFELTPLGQQEARDWVKTSQKVQFFEAPPSPDVTVFRVPLAKRQLVAVTGIATDPGGKTALAEFNWKWAATPQGKRLEKDPPSEIRRGAAQLQLFDDGWRIRGLEL